MLAARTLCFTCRRLPAVALALALATGCSRVEPAPASSQLTAAALGSLEPGHLLVTLRLADGQLTVLSARAVSSPLPRARAAASALQPWRLELLGENAEVRYVTPLPRSDVLHADRLGPDGQLSGSAHRLQSTAFPARLPATAGPLTLVLRDAATGEVLGRGTKLELPR